VSFVVKIKTSQNNLRKNQFSIGKIDLKYD
jgi:hypothetical protein